MHHVKQYEVWENIVHVTKVSVLIIQCLTNNVTFLSLGKSPAATCVIMCKKGGSPTRSNLISMPNLNFKPKSDSIVYVVSYDYYSD